MDNQNSFNNQAQNPNNTPYQPTQPNQGYNYSQAPGQAPNPVQQGTYQSGTYNVPPQQYPPAGKPKKPFYKKWWFWVIVVIVLLGFIGSLGSEDDKSDENATSTTVAEETTEATTTTTTTTTTTKPPTTINKKAYKESCKKYNYKDISRDPEKYKGKKAKFKGQVVQVQEDSFLGTKTTVLRVNVTATKNQFAEGGYLYDDTIYVVYYPSENESRILEEDIITIYGELDGIETYTAVTGAKISIPKVKAKFISINS